MVPSGFHVAVPAAPWLGTDGVRLVLLIGFSLGFSVGYKVEYLYQYYVYIKIYKNIYYVYRQVLDNSRYFGWHHSMTSVPQL